MRKLVCDRHTTAKLCLLQASQKLALCILKLCLKFLLMSVTDLIGPQIIKDEEATTIRSLCIH